MIVRKMAGQSVYRGSFASGIRSLSLPKWRESFVLSGRPEEPPNGRLAGKPEAHSIRTFHIRILARGLSGRTIRRVKLCVYLSQWVNRRRA